MDQHENAQDQSSYIETVEFTDENGDPTIPVAGTVSWTLTDGNGEIVNERENVPITDVAATVYVAMYGADLNVDETGGRAENLRCLVVKAEYISALTGTQLPVKKAVKFLVTDLPQV